ncbi:hypothetical protein CCACVL1_27762 [Corchorus capsularis]|uniref:Uncharacterized protein n=1 Tax=Corchorus capsularis TaxID=210143 RepID=A0A1R3G8X0_COCAP|nr:hypothetical protein CCACVL1_27762 [Corchorus capsularis]
MRTLKVKVVAGMHVRRDELAW